MPHITSCSQECPTQITAFNHQANRCFSQLLTNISKNDLPRTRAAQCGTDFKNFSWERLKDIPVQGSIVPKSNSERQQRDSPALLCL
jgi:hypothetical protein